MKIIFYITFSWVLISCSLMIKHDISLYDSSYSNGTFWESKSRIKKNSGSGLHILSNNQLREYFYNSNERIYNDYGGDIAIDTLSYAIKNEILYIKPYHTWKIVKCKNDSLLLVDFSSGKPKGDTIVYLKSTDQKTIPH